MEDIVNIVKREIIDKMDVSLSISNIEILEVAPEVFISKITVCDIKWARIGKYVIDEIGVFFNILEIDYNLNLITVQNSFESLSGLLYVPHYFYGTPLQVNSEWGAVTKIEVNKIPFIWLIEPLNENTFGRDNSLERTSEIRLLFVDGRFVTNWKVKDIHEFRIQSLLNMVDQFKESVNGNRIFQRVTDYRVKTLTKLGSESEQGFLKNILDANLTAVELRFTLPIYKGYDCKC
jgi:hypothetical protein